MTTLLRLECHNLLAPTGGCDPNGGSSCYYLFALCVHTVGILRVTEKENLGVVFTCQFIVCVSVCAGDHWKAPACRSVLFD